MNIGILGGSFDPIHNGHLNMACCAHQEFDLDQIWLMPAGHSPNKDESAMTDAYHRLQMCQIAAGAYDWLWASSFEIDAPELSYTYRTFEKLAEQYPQHRFFFLMGGDSLDYFEQWMHPEIIVSLCTILVIPRDEFDHQQLREKIRKIQERFSCEIQIVPCEKNPVSSTQIRWELKEGKADERCFPPGVLDYIKKNHLYQYS